MQSHVHHSSDARKLRHPVLVVDDNEDVRMVMVQILEQDYAVLATDNGAEAVALARDFRPELIVCDSEMPGLRGRDVLMQLRSEPELAGIPFILMSGFPFCPMKHGAEMEHSFLLKPFVPSELLDCVNRALKTGPVDRHVAV